MNFFPCFGLVWLTCFTPVKPLFSYVYPKFLESFHNSSLNMKNPLFIQQARIVILPDSVLSWNSVNMSCKEAAGNWQSRKVKGCAWGIGGGGFEQALESTSFMGSKGFSALALFFTPTKCIENWLKLCQKHPPVWEASYISGTSFFVLDSCPVCFVSKDSAKNYTPRKS